MTTTAAAHGHAPRRRWRGLVVAGIIVALLVSCFVALGGWGHSRPYYGAATDANTDIAITSWVFAIHSATVTKEGVVVDVTITNRTKKTEYDIHYLTLAVAMPQTGGYVTSAACKPKAGAYPYGPGLTYDSTCVISAGTGEDLPPKGSFDHVYVVVRDDAEFDNGDPTSESRTGKNIVNYVSLSVRDQR